MLIHTKKIGIYLRNPFLQIAPYWARRLRIFFLIMALIGAFSAQMINAHAYRSIASEYSIDKDIKDADLQDYILPGTRFAIYSGILSGILAGVMFLHFGGWTKIGSGTRFAFLLMQVWMLIHTIVAFYEAPLPLSEIRGIKGPLVWMSCTILFAGTDKDAWKIFSKMVYVFAFITSGIVLFGMATLPSFSSDLQACRFFQGYLPILLWTAPLVLLNINDDSITLHKLLLRSFPFSILCMVSFLSAGRSWIIITMLFTIVLIFRFKRILHGRPLLLYLLILSLSILVISSLAFFSDPIEDVFYIFSGSLFKDTRTEQYIEFLSQISLFDLALGTGPRGTWFWNGEDYAYIDGAYTLMAFNGGLPLVVSYIVIMILPAFRVLRTRPSWEDAAPAVILLFWALALTGLSTYTNPSVSIEHYILCIYAGRCFGYLYEKRRL